MEAKRLALSEIVIDAGTQARSKINEQTVERYAQDMVNGAVFPKIRVFYDGNRYILGDGFHRYLANKRNGMEFIDAICEPGTAEDALLYGFAANLQHGEPISLEDRKANAVRMFNHHHWSTWSNAEIARRCGLSPTTVATMRGSNAPKERKYQDAKGNIRTKKVAQPKPKKEPEVKPEPSQPAAEGEYDPMHDAIEELKRENDRLTLQAAMSASEIPEDEKISLQKLYETTKEELRICLIELEAVKKSRDMYMTENGELKKQVKSMMARMKKMQGAAHA